MKETQAYKTYLGFATGATPPKKVRKFKKPASLKLTTIPVSTEEPMGKLKRVKRPAKKSTKTSARGVVIRETPKMPLTKKKEKGNDEDGSNNEQDLSGEDSDQENDSDDDKNQSDNENESDLEHETDENDSDSECGHEENEEDEDDDDDDEEEVKDEFVKTLSNDSDDEDETMITDKAEGDEDEEMDYTTSQLYDDVDIRLNELVDTDKGFVQEEDIPHTDAGIVSPMDVHVHHEVPSQQTPTLFTVPVSVISDSSLVFSTVILQSLPSFTPPSQQLTSTLPPTTEAINLPSSLLDFASVFQFNYRVTTLEKEVVELKKEDPLKTQVTALVDEHLDARLGATKDEFMNYLLASITARITKQVKNQLLQILPEDVSNFSPLVIQKMVKESLEDVVLAKESSQPQSSYEAAATLTKFKLKKILIDKMDKSESYIAAPKHRQCYEGLIKSYELDTTIFSTYGKVYSLKRSRKDKDEDPFDGSDRGLKKRKTSKDAKPSEGPKAKESQSISSKGKKSQSKSFGKSVQSEELMKSNTIYI
nr:hypothetical protein [Tanacetum cinerariifolium]